MNTGGIDSGRIEAMIAQLRAAANRPQGAAEAQALAPVTGAAAPVAKLNFADALKASLDSVNASQEQAATLGRRFTLGDDTVGLSDVMISAQKANINFQAALQVRNKLVTAYHDIMNMQV